MQPHPFPYTYSVVLLISIPCKYQISLLTKIMIEEDANKTT